MATVPLFSQFPCKTLIPSSSNSKPQSKSPIILPINSINRRSEVGIAVHRPDFKVRATDVNDEWGSDAAEKRPSSSSVSVAEKEAEEAIESVEETERLKRALADSLYGTERGLRASSETRAEISELITQLESKNPTPAPNDALFLLNGKWILAYTSFVGLFPLLSRRIEPLVKVDEISQTIDSDSFTVQNSVRFAGPLATTSFSTNAKFEIRSPKRVQIKFEQGVIGTPQLTDSIEIPEFVEVLGQKIDLNPIKGLLTSVQDTASSVARTISNQPPLKFSLPSDNTQSWLLTTYLDKDLRISRGDGGSVFVLIKEGSSLLNP
ncbi:putative plastid-lipid-associated protein 1 [Cardamine amara subsp. amara]|uniref:Plastid-lipid-associated protein 1 n=1 Tax=Cardamine amara subsp. amara TaxID=228776 RepID=A0ABD1AY04_CARAN